MLLKPEGVKDFLPSEAYAKREIENKIMGVLKSWGYREVITSTLESGANYPSGVKAGLEDRIYRFFDGRGGTLVLRPDWTLPLARLATNCLQSEPFPLRLAYQGNIFRFESPQSGKRREIFQAGGELLGAKGALADCEIMVLSLEALFAVGLTDLKVCIGHTGFLNTLLQSFKVKRKIRQAIVTFLIKRDFVSLRAYVDANILEPSLKKALFHLPELKGGRDTIYKAADLLTNPARKDFLNNVIILWETLAQRGFQDNISFDYSFLRDLQYYTGFIFEIYTPSWGYPLGGGGRYDRLLEFCEHPLPAVGFALSIDYILSLWQRKGKINRVPLHYFVGFDPSHYAQTLQEVRALRSRGYAVILDVKGLGPEEGLSRAKELGAQTFRFYCKEGLLEEDLRDDLAGEREDKECKT